MNCPGCGAAMHVVDNRNHLRCDHCGRLHFPEETGDGVVPLGEPSTKSCPVCHVLLEKALIEGEDARYCQQCRGFLTTMDAFGRIVTRRRALHRPDEQVTEPFDPESLIRQLRCPACDGRMEAHPYYGGGNAAVDTCAPCQAIWLDAGELAVIERFLPHVRQVDPVLPLAPEPSPTDDTVLVSALPIFNLTDLL